MPRRRGPSKSLLLAITAVSPVTRRAVWPVFAGLIRASAGIASAEILIGKEPARSDFLTPG